MKTFAIIALIIFILSMIAAGPVFMFAWLLSMRFFLIGIVCFALGYYFGRKRR